MTAASKRAASVESTALFEWDGWNLNHIRRHRGVTRELVELAMNDPVAVGFEYEDG